MQLRGPNTIILGIRKEVQHGIRTNEEKGERLPEPLMARGREVSTSKELTFAVLTEWQSLMNGQLAAHWRVLSRGELLRGSTQALYYRATLSLVTGTAYCQT